MHARQLSETLVQRGVSLFVLTQRRPRGVVAEERVGEVPVVRVASGGSDRWGKYLMMLPAFVHLVRMRRRYDVVYVCGLRTLGVPALIAGRLFGKPVVLRAESCTEMSGEYALERTGALRPLAAAALAVRNALYRRAAAFVTISDELTAEFREAGVPEDRITRIWNGVDTTRFRPPQPGEPARLREQLRLPRDATLVLYTGKLNRGKGLEMLLRAWERLSPTAAGGTHLVLVGGGANQFLSCERELRDFVAGRGLSSTVTFTGYVDHVEDYLMAGDVFTLPSDSEALGISLLEALACGLPAVVTDAGGMPEVVTHGREGLLVPVGNEDRLVEALARLLENPELRRRMGRAGRRTVLGRFGIDVVAEAHERLFRRVLAGEAAG